MLRSACCVTRQCVIGVRETAEDSSVVSGGDEGPLRFLLRFLLALLHLLLQRGVAVHIKSVLEVGHFRLREVVWLSFASPVAFFPLGLRLLRAGRWSLFSRD